MGGEAATGPLKLTVMEGSFSVCRLPAGSAVPDWATSGDFFSVTRTADELSVACASERVPDGTRVKTGWALLKVEGPLPFHLTGILAGLSGALADAGISLFAISTYDTDYLLVQEDGLEQAIGALEGAGHAVEGS